MRAQGMSAITAALAAGLKRDTIRSVLRGRSPSLGRVVAICEALGLELRIGRPGEALQQELEHLTGHARIVPADEFSRDNMLPVREWREPWRAGDVTGSARIEKAPAPVGFEDSAGFYAVAESESMGPARIWRGDYCLISPTASAEPPCRVWLRSKGGLETIVWLVRVAPAAYEFVGWAPPSLEEDMYQKIRAQSWKREEVVDRGAVVAVYKGSPSTTRTTPQAADWPSRRPARL